MTTTPLVCELDPTAEPVDVPVLTIPVHLYLPTTPEARAALVAHAAYLDDEDAASLTLAEAVVLVLHNDPAYLFGSPTKPGALGGWMFADEYDTLPDDDHLLFDLPL